MIALGRFYQKIRVQIVSKYYTIDVLHVNCLAALYIIAVYLTIHFKYITVHVPVCP